MCTNITMWVIPRTCSTRGQHLPSQLPVRYLPLSQEAATVSSQKCKPSPPQWLEQPWALHSGIRWNKQHGFLLSRCRMSGDTLCLPTLASLSVKWKHQYRRKEPESLLVLWIQQLELIIHTMDSSFIQLSNRPLTVSHFL